MLDRINDGWTDARVELLKSLYQSGSDGWLALELNKLTGSGFTRNAVISKRERLKLFRSKEHDSEYKRLDSKEGRGKNAGQLRRGKHPKRIFQSGFKSGASQPADLETLERIESTAPPPDFLALSLFDLTDFTCRYPRGAESPFLFCGQPVKKNSSYCEHCHSLCYERETPYERRRREESGAYLMRVLA